MKIFLNNIWQHAYHGVMSQERVVGADFLVTVEAETNQTASVESDQLTDTVNYADMADTIREEMSKPSKLLEHVAGRIGHSLLRKYPTLTQVTVRLTKLTPPIAGLQCEGAGVEISLKSVEQNSVF